MKMNKMVEQLLAIQPQKKRTIADYTSTFVERKADALRRKRQEAERAAAQAAEEARRLDSDAGKARGEEMSAIWELENIKRYRRNEPEFVAYWQQQAEQATRKREADEARAREAQLQAEQKRADARASRYANAGAWFKAASKEAARAAEKTRKAEAAAEAASQQEKKLSKMLDKLHGQYETKKRSGTLNAAERTKLSDAIIKYEQRFQLAEKKRQDARYAASTAASEAERKRLDMEAAKAVVLGLRA